MLLVLGEYTLCARIAMRELTKEEYLEMKKRIQESMAIASCLCGDIRTIARSAKLICEDCYDRR